MAKLKQTKNRKRIEDFRAKNPEVFEKYEKKNGTNTQSGTTKSK